MGPDDRKWREAGTLGIAHTRQSGSDKLAGFRTRNGPFSPRTSRILARRCHDVLSSVRDITRSARGACVIYSGLWSPSPGVGAPIPVRLRYECVRKCVCTRARRGPQAKDPVSPPGVGSRPSGGSPGGSEPGITITQACPASNYSCLLVEFAKKRRQKRNGADVAARRSGGKDGRPSSGHGQDARRLPGLPFDAPR